MEGQSSFVDEVHRKSGAMPDKVWELYLLTGMYNTSRSDRVSGSVADGKEALQAASSQDVQQC